MKKYAIVAPNNRVFASADDHQEALDRATELSLQWGALFVVRPSTQRAVSFPAQRAKVMRLAREYFDAHQKFPGTLVEKRAKFHFNTASRVLNRNIKALEEITTEDRQFEIVRP